MPTVKVNGIDLFYRIQGSGEPLLLIAGFFCDHSYWTLLMPSLVSRYQVIRFDNRGMGRSSKPDRPYSIKQMATDAAALLDQLGISSVHVAGHSMGGQIAQELALSYPRKVQSLILLASWAKADARFSAILEMLGDLPRKIDLSLYQKILLPWVYTNAFYSMPGFIEQLAELLRNDPLLPPPYALYHQSRAILANDTIDRLNNIHCPTLVLVSEQDILTPVQFSEQLAQGIVNAELVVINQGGHGFLIESPNAVVPVMLNFLKKQAQDQSLSNPANSL